MSPDPVAADALAAADDVGAPQEVARNRPLTRPRPGHADLVGMQKYGFDDARPVLERASARETAARVALGCVAVGLPRAGLRHPAGLAHRGDRHRGRWPTTRCCRPRTTWTRSTPTRCAASTPPGPRRWSPRSRRPARTATPSAASSRSLAYGLPPGLGSHVHWDRRLDAQLAAALMGIQAIKGVEVGDGFRTAARRGSAGARRDGARRRRRDPAPHRPRRRHRGRHVHRRRAAGPRGDEADQHGARARWTPSTSPPASRPRRSTSAPTSAPSRPPAWWPRRWSRWCWPRRAREVRRRLASPRPRATTAATSTRSPRRCARGERHRPPAGRPRRAAGVGQDHGRAERSRRGSGSPCATPTRPSRQAAGRSDLRHLRRRRRGDVPRARAARGPGALAGHDGVLSLGGGAVLDRRTPSGCWPATPSSSSHVGIADAAKRVGFDRSRPLLALQPARAVGAADGRSAARSTSGCDRALRRHRRPHPRGRRRRDRGPAGATRP